MSADPSKRSGENERVHDAQVALVHFAVLHPACSDARHRSLHNPPPGRRFVLGGPQMAAFRTRVALEVSNHLDGHPGLTIDEIANLAAVAGEHALQNIGVERAL